MSHCRCIPLFIVLIYSGACSHSLVERDANLERMLFGTAEVIQVCVTGAEYQWEFLVPGRDGLIGTSDDVKLHSVLWLPPGRQVRLRFSSRDYVYTFLQTDLKINEVAVPGVSTEASFLSPAEGEFDISASPLCGFMFAHESYQPYIKVGRPEELPVHDHFTPI